MSNDDQDVNIRHQVMCNEIHKFMELVLVFANVVCHCYCCCRVDYLHYISTDCLFEYI